MEALGALSWVEAQQRRQILGQVSRRWTVMLFSSEVIERAKEPFPVEPVRSLDAVHLASALVAQRIFPSLTLLSLDQRIRNNAPPLGLLLSL